MVVLCPPSRGYGVCVSFTPCGIRGGRIGLTRLTLPQISFYQFFFFSFSSHPFCSFHFFWLHSISSLELDRVEDIYLKNAHSEGVHLSNNALYTVALYFFLVQLLQHWNTILVTWCKPKLIEIMRNQVTVWKVTYRWDQNSIECYSHIIH